MSGRMCVTDGAGSDLLRRFFARYYLEYFIGREFRHDQALGISLSFFSAARPNTVIMLVIDREGRLGDVCEVQVGRSGELFEVRRAIVGRCRRVGGASVILSTNRRFADKDERELFVKSASRLYDFLMAEGITMRDLIGVDGFAARSMIAPEYLFDYGDPTII